RRQWSGNAHAVIPGIGVVTCVYVNPELQRFWVLDFRLFDPERDGRNKNDFSEASTSAVGKQTAVRCKIEQFHRQWKQTTGVQRCQCRKQRAQRNHIPASLLAWAHLHQAAMRAKTTVYALKQGLLDDYLCKQLRNPAFAITSA
ncbi:MAG: hypothetical protein VX417_02300, partial [SAR324 cluster bacterium]|nr:hypothetical protein [SAR324 cluster bacterium]